MGKGRTADRDGRGARSTIGDRVGRGGSGAGRPTALFGHGPGSRPSRGGLPAATSRPPTPWWARMWPEPGSTPPARRCRRSARGARAAGIRAGRPAPRRGVRPLAAAPTCCHGGRLSGQWRGLEPTARYLFVHPNTVRYRLHRVADLTGRDPWDPRDLLVLQTAVILGRLATALTRSGSGPACVTQSPARTPGPAGTTGSLIVPAPNQTNAALCTRVSSAKSGATLHKLVKPALNPTSAGAGPPGSISEAPAGPAGASTRPIVDSCQGSSPHRRELFNSRLRRSPGISSRAATVLIPSSSLRRLRWTRGRRALCAPRECRVPGPSVRTDRTDAPAERALLVALAKGIYADRRLRGVPSALGPLLSPVSRSRAFVLASPSCLNTHASGLVGGGIARDADLLRFHRRFSLASSGSGSAVQRLRIGHCTDGLRFAAASRT